MRAGEALRHRYGDGFERALNGLQPEALTVLLLADHGDEAVTVWREALPAATIVVCAEDTARDDAAFIAGLADVHAPAIVVDVASCLAPSQLLGLHAVYPRLAPGSLYIAEGQPTDGRGALVARLAQLAAVIRHPERRFWAFPDALTAELVARTRAVWEFGGHWMCQRKPATQPSAAARPSNPASTRAIVPVVPVRDVAETTIELDNGGNYARRPARITGARGWLADSFAQRVARPVVEPPAATVSVLRDVTVHARGIISARGGVVAESLLNTQDAERFGPFARDPGAGLRMQPEPVVRRYPDRNYVLLKQTWDDNFGHWLYETLPRIDLIAEKFALAECRFVVADDGGVTASLHRDTLKLFGIAPEQIERTSDDPIAFDRLIYPAPMTVQPWVKAPRVLRVLESLPARCGRLPPGPERIYLSRSAGYVRQLLNEDALIPILEARGFVIAFPERLSFRDQLWLFHDARIVVGNLGAALSLTGVCRAGVTLFALTTELMQDDFFWDIVCHKQGSYHSLHGKATDPDLGMRSDFHIEVEQFRDMLDDALHAAR